MAIAALKAGKHVYLEKPIAHTIDEGFEIVKVWEQSKKICQVGTQNRSSTIYKKAKELIQQGMIGDVHYVRAFWYRNSLPNDPAWRYVIPADANPQNTDFAKFLGNAPKHAFDKQRSSSGAFTDYSGASRPTSGAQTDITTSCAKRRPKSSSQAAASIVGPIRPTIATCPYASDLRVPTTSTSTTPATSATITRLRRADPRQKAPSSDESPGSVLHARSVQGRREQVKSRQPIHLNGMKDFQEGDGAINHFKNFIQSILGKEQPIAPPPVGQQAAIGGHMATLSYKNQKKVTWDDVAKKVRLG